MQYGPDKVPVSNVSIIIGPPTKGPEPVPVTTTEEILEPPTTEPLVTLKNASGNIVPAEPPPYNVAVAEANVLVTPKVLELNFIGAGVNLINDGNGVVTINISGEPIGGYVVAGTGISVSTTNGVSTVTNSGILGVSAGNGISAATVNGVATVTNTGILTVSAGNGISASTVNGATTVTNTGILSVSAGSGISASTVNGVATITNTNMLSISAGNGISAATVGNVTTVTNTGVLNVLAGNSISVSTTNGNATVTNTFTETVYAGGSWSGAVTPNHSFGVIQSYTLTGNITLNVPTNMASGQSLTLILTQDVGGGRLLDANVAYLFASGFQTLSTDSGAIDMINIFRAGSTYYATLTVGYS